MESRNELEIAYCQRCGKALIAPLCGQYRRKSVKQMDRNLYSETAETCTLRCEYCGKYTQDSDLSTEWVGDKYLMCSKCKEKHT